MPIIDVGTEYCIDKTPDKATFHRTDCTQPVEGEIAPCNYTTPATPEKIHAFVARFPTMHACPVCLPEPDGGGT